MAATRDASEMIVSMAALILQDEKMDISPENINKILEAAGAKVEPYWPKLFCQALAGVDVGSLMTAVSSAPAPAAAGAVAGGAPAAAAAPAEKAKEEEPEEEEEDDMGFSLFD